LTKYRWTIFVAVVAIALPVVASGAGASGENEGPNTATVTITGHEIFRPNFYAQTFAFPEEATVIRSGGTITWNNQSTDGHSISLVNAKSDLPTSINGNAIADALFGLHNAPTGGPPNGPLVTYVDGGQPNDDDTVPDADVLPDFDTGSHLNGQNAPTIGDSHLIDDPQHQFGFPNTFTAKVTAPAGSSFYYFCIFHAQMQGAIRVVG